MTADASSSPPAKPPQDGRLPRTVVLLSWTSFFSDVASELIAPLLPSFLTGPLGAGRIWVGAVEGAADSVTSLIKPWAGRWSDRMGRRKPLVVAGYTVAALARPFMGLATAAWQVLSIRFTDRVGKGLRSAPRDALVREATGPRHSGRAFGLQRGMDHAGALTGSLLAAWLLSVGIDQRNLFLLPVLPGLLSVAMLLFVREAAEPVPRPPARASEGPLPPRLAQWFVPVGLFALASSSSAFLLLRAQDLGVPIVLLPVLWAVHHVVKATVSYGAGAWSDHVPRARLLVAGWAVFVLSYVGFAFATEAWHAWALFLLQGVHHGLSEPTERALVGDLAPAGSRGRAYGVYGLVQGSLALPASLLTGFLWDRTNAVVAFLVSAGLAAAAVLLLGLWMARGRGAGRDVETGV